MNIIDQYLITLNEANGSDLHLVSNLPPMMRKKGDLVSLPEAPLLSSQDIQNLIYPILSKERQAYFEKHNDLDAAYAIENIARFRLNVFRDINGIGAVLRRIPNQLPKPESINIPERILKFAKIKKGLILVTGPTGSGKSTTLSCLIDLINQNDHRHILTIEDPIEFIHQPKNCRITQREVNVHTKSFAKALRSSMRQDPDIILVGEMRDKETIQLALTAAEMGMLVFGTLHTNGSYKTINRIIDVFPAKEKNQIRTVLSSCLMGIISQLLIKDISETKIIPLFESIHVTSGIRSTIRDGKVHQIPSLIQAANDPLTQTFDDALTHCYESGSISKEIFNELCIDRKDKE